MTPVPTLAPAPTLALGALALIPTVDPTPALLPELPALIPGLPAPTLATGAAGCKHLPRPWPGRMATGIVIVVALVAAATLASCSSQLGLDGDFPSDNPVVEPVVENELSSTEAPPVLADPDSTDYGLVALLALCLIGAGVLLIKVERWQQRRSDTAGGPADG